MSLMLSELIDTAIHTLENYGDMRVIIDVADEDEFVAVEMRRELDPATHTYDFVVADYIYKVPAVRLVK